MFEFSKLKIKNKFASTGSRTRNSCLEGNYANRYTIDAFNELNIQ